MTIVHGENAETFEMQGNRITRLIAPSTGAKEIMAWRGKMQAGAASPPKDGQESPPPPWTK